MKRNLESWYGRYGDISYAESRKNLTKTELIDFNSEAGTSYKQITRFKSLRILIKIQLDELLKQQQQELSVFLESLWLGLITSYGEVLEVDVAPKEFIDKPWGTATLSFMEQMVMAYAVWAKSLPLDVKVSIIQGDDPIPDVEAKFIKLHKRLKTLVLTQGTYMNFEAQKMVTKQSRYVYHAVLDSNTCGNCASLDGCTFLYSDSEPGVNRPPMHGHCRCYTVPE